MRSRICVLLVILALMSPMLLNFSYAQEIKRPVVFVYSMEANFRPEGHFNSF